MTTPTSEASPAADVLRASVRELINDSGLKQVFVAERLGITPKHMSQLLLGKTAMTVDWAAKVADVCRQPLRLDIEPTEWVVDVVSWRERAEQAEAAMLRARAVADIHQQRHPYRLPDCITCTMAAALDQPADPSATGS